MRPLLLLFCLAAMVLGSCESRSLGGDAVVYGPGEPIPYIDDQLNSDFSDHPQVDTLRLLMRLESVLKAVEAGGGFSGGSAVGGAGFGAALLFAVQWIIRRRNAKRGDDAGPK